MEVMLPAPWDLEYCPTFKDIVKELGGQWDNDGKVWSLPADAQLPPTLEGYVLQ